MRRCTEVCVALVLATCLAAGSAHARRVVLVGEVRAVDAQQVITPHSNSHPVVIRYFVPEGEPVKAGEVVLRIDAGQSAAQVPELEAQIEQAGARVAKEVAELEVKVIDAELALVDAEADLAVARLDASVPADLISGLDHDRYQGELDRATREAALKQDELRTAREAVQRRIHDGELEVEKLSVQRNYHAALVDAAQVRADRDGIVVHGFNNNWLGGRIDEGSSTMPGSTAGQVVGSGRMRAQAWVLESDRAALRAGQPAQLAFDALPGRSAPGTIVSVSGAPERRPEWGEGRWFAVEVDFDSDGLRLLPGMSVRVVANAGAAAAAAPARAQPQRTLRIDGEVYARRSSPLMPPSIDRMWQFNLTQMAPDGSPVKEGDVVIAFDSSEVMRQLTEKQSQLEAKRRELEKLDLDLAERTRSEGLATEAAHAELEKARRKTEQPRELVAALEYGKLVEQRHRAQRRLVLAERREAVAAGQRRQERRLTASELAQLEADVARLQASMAALTLTAPRAGVMMHRSNWNKEKFDVGSQVWMGQTVAEIPDADSLAVRAELPERDLLQVTVGAPARVVVEGGGGSVHRGRVAAIGRAVRSKSQIQPIPVLDLDIELEDPAVRLRPGQSVRVELAAAGGDA